VPKAASELLELLVLLTCWRARQGTFDIMLLWVMNQGETSVGDVFSDTFGDVFIKLERT